MVIDKTALSKFRTVLLAEPPIVTAIVVALAEDLKQRPQKEDTELD